jgi:hypothetical protein
LSTKTHIDNIVLHKRTHQLLARSKFQCIETPNKLKKYQNYRYQQVHYNTKTKKCKDVARTNAYIKTWFRV